MKTETIALIGYLGPLAHAVAENLAGRGFGVSLVDAPHRPEELCAEPPARVILFPFPATSRRETLAQTNLHLTYLRSAVRWARTCGVGRIVIRSHAIAYGISMKNPGLLDEGRTTLLPKESSERRWLEAEAAVLADGSGPPVPEGSPVSRASVAAVRLASVLDPGEGDLIAVMLGRRVTSPLAGYDPQLQLLSLSDAAECLASAALSDARGIFNGAPEGTVPVRAALKAANAFRFPVNGVLQKPFRQFLWKRGLAAFPGEAMDRLKYNWTISNLRSHQSFGFRARATSSRALRDYLSVLGRGRPEGLQDRYDEFGQDESYIRRWRWWFHFLTRLYWRAEFEGIEHVPSTGAGLLVSNHRGFMPFDGVVHRTLILDYRRRHIRFLVIPSLFKFPFLSDFLVKQGGVVASQANSRKLFERNELVGIFPEGIAGAFRMYRGAYRLGDFGRNAFARMAIENGVPIIPAATIGHVETFPILARVDSPLVVRSTGWPFLPITPTFPLLPVPLPTKWHIRYLEPVPVDEYAPGDAADPEAVNALAAKVREILQRSIDEMLARRKHLFFGRIFERRPRADVWRAKGVAG